MRTLNNKIKIDGFKESVENALGMRAKKLKEMAATAGFATIYGLLFAGLLLAPLPLPSGKVQAQCAEFDPNDCAHPCYVPRPDYSNDEFHDAASREDCDRILKEVLEDINDRWENIEAAGKAAIACDTDYADDLKTNDLAHKAAYASAANTGKGLLLTCLGLGTPVVTGVSARVGWISGGKISITLARVGTGVLGGITFLASLVFCKRLANGAAQDEIDVADKIKEHADIVALRDRDRCRETTNYYAATRQYRYWKGPYKGRRGGWRLSMRRQLQDQARADYRKCLEQFPVGDCGTTE